MANQHQLEHPSNNQNTQIHPPPRPLSHTHHPQPHKFYLERYPSYLSYHDLRARLLQIGSVQSLFMARKPNKAGRRFGFCTLFSKDSTDDKLRSLNNIWFDSYKLRVNLARFETRHTQGKIPQNPFKPVARLKSPPFRTRDHRTYATVLQTMDNPHHLMSAQETCLPQKPLELDSMKETVIYSPKPQDISWLNNCLLASISAGVDYGKIQDDQWYFKQV